MVTAFLRRWRFFWVPTLVAATALVVASISATLSGEREALPPPPLPDRHPELRQQQARAVDAARPSKPADAPVKPATTVPSYVFGPGDRLKVAFYERSDLSGEFRVRADGRISLPVIGTILVEGKDATELETDIAAAFFAATKRSAYVNVEVVERRPFYVVGFVNKPGAYPYVPGMTVVHALAIAGGVYRTTATANSNIDLSREIWRRKQALDALRRAVARLARLEAERDGLEAGRTPDRLVRLAGQEHAEVLMASERRIHDSNRRVLKQRMEGLVRVEKLAEEEIKAQRMRLESMREQEKLRKSELQDTEKLANRGLTRRDLLYSRKYGISALKGEASQVIAEIARAERTLAQAKRDQSMLGVETRKAAQAEITAAEKEIESFEHAVKASEDAMQLIGGAVPADAASPHRASAAVTYEIMRRQGNGYRTATASASSELHPGDVLRVAKALPKGKPPVGTTAGIARSTGQHASEPVEARPRSRPVRTRTAAVSPTAPVSAIPAPETGTGEILVKLRETLHALDTLKQRMGQAEQERRQIIDLMKLWRARAIDMNNKLTALDAVWREASHLLKQDAKQPARPSAPPGGEAERSSALPAERTPSLRVLELETPRTREERILVARVLQTELKRVGCYRGQIDGIWGQQSVSALSRFGSNMDVPVDADQPSGTALKAVLDVDTRVCRQRGTP